MSGFKFALGLSAVYLVGYLFAMRQIGWLEMLHPRGGIAGFGLYLAMASGMLLWAPKSPSARLQLTMSGWLLLAMPPLWFFILANA